MSKQKIDLQKHTSDKASTWYLVKLIFYMICIIILSIVMYYQYRELTGAQTESIQNQKEIKGVTIDSEDQSSL
ncbi:MAG: hypothetical protein ACO2Z9_08750 [Crocinitomicaceae bacterium]